MSWLNSYLNCSRASRVLKSWKEQSTTHLSVTDHKTQFRRLKHLGASLVYHTTSVHQVPHRYATSHWRQRQKVYYKFEAILRYIMRHWHKIIIINLNEYRILFSACIGFITVAVMKYSVRARKGGKCSSSPQFQASGCHGRAVMVIG